ncbi:hypothetical protein KGY71_02655 [Candidatus Bipolaricaulota bacterium]|nr:hypothetical protein [Candidatus Bipolaricaulota bacterium]
MPIGSGAILRSGFGAKALGMGGAFVAVADDYSAAYWNPAGITRSSSLYLGGTHYDKYGLGLNLDYLSAGLSVPSSAHQRENSLIPALPLPFLEKISLAGTYVGFSTNVRTSGPGGSEIPITYSERSYLGTAGFRFPAVGSIGFSLKNYSYSAPNSGVGGLDASAHGLGFDIGVLSEPLEGLNFGAVAFDIAGTDITWKNTPTEPTNIVPSRYSVGTAYTLDFSRFSITESIPGKLTVAGQYTFGPNIAKKIRSGVEYGISIFSLRAGVVKPLSGSARFTAGAGFDITLITVDIAWIQNSSLEGENTSDTLVFSSEFEF